QKSLPKREHAPPRGFPNNKRKAGPPWHNQLHNPCKSIIAQLMVPAQGRSVLRACLRALTRLEEGVDGDDDSTAHHNQEDHRRYRYSAALHAIEVQEES